MPNHDDSNPPVAKFAFPPELLALLEEHGEPVTADDALAGAFWRVLKLDDESWGLYRMAERPEHGHQPYGVLRDRQVALLAAAFLPHLSRGRTFWSQRLPDGKGQTLHRYGQDLGQVRNCEDEVLELLNLGDAMARSPESLASLMEAVGPSVLVMACEILISRVTGGS